MAIFRVQMAGNNSQYSKNYEERQMQIEEEKLDVSLYIMIMQTNQKNPLTIL